jgi:hemolysin activation/secretion protein
MNRQPKLTLKNLLLGIAIASGYLVANIPVYATPTTKAKPKDTKITQAKTIPNQATSIAKPKPKDTKITQAKTIQRIKLIGNTVLSPETLAPILQSLEDKAISPEQVEIVAEAITQLYISKGYVTSLAQFDPLDPKSVVNGVAQIKVIEGQIERVDILGLVHTNPDYVRSRLDLGMSKPFNANRMEDHLRLLRVNPLFRKITSSLRPSTSDDKSILIVQIEEENQFGGSVSFDNYSPVSVGSERLGAGLTYRNLTGFGDLLSASYYRSTTGGSNLFDFSYTIPVNPMNGTVAIRYSPNNYRITDPTFAAFNIRGGNSLYDRLSPTTNSDASRRVCFILKLCLSDWTNFLV